MKYTLALMTFFFAIASNAGQLGTRVQKTAFVENAVQQIVYNKGASYRLVENSVVIRECTSLLSRAGEKIKDLTQSGVGDCDSVQFQVRDARGRVFSGEIEMNSEHVTRRNLGIIKERSMIPALAAYYENSVDPKTNKPMYFGFFTTNQSRNQAEMTADEIFSLKPVPTPRSVAPAKSAR